MKAVHFVLASILVACSTVPCPAQTVAGITAVTSGLGPKNEPVQVPVNCSSRYRVAVKADATHSYRFTITLRSNYPANDILDRVTSFDLDLAPGEIANGTIVGDWDFAERIGEHTLTVTIEASKLTAGNQPEVSTVVAKESAVYQVEAKRSVEQ